MILTSLFAIFTSLLLGAVATPNNNVKLRDASVAYKIYTLEGLPYPTKLEICSGSIVIPVTQIEVANGSYGWSPSVVECELNFRETLASKKDHLVAQALISSVVIPNGYENQMVEPSRHLEFSLGINQKIQVNTLDTLSKLKDGKFSVTNQSTDGSFELEVKYLDEGASETDFAKP